MTPIKEILSKSLFKVASLNGISILIKIAIGFITSKFIALFIGPSGMALVGNLRNFLTTIESVGTLGFQNGIVKYIAECNQDDVKLKQTISTIFISVLISCMILGIGVFVFSDQLNVAIFGLNYNFSFIFKVLALAMPFYVGTIVLIAVINGFSYFKKVIYINIIGNIIGLLTTILLIWKFNIDGALLGIVLTPSLLFFVSYVVLNREVKLFNSFKFQFFEFSILKNLSSYSLMALVSSVIGPIVYLAIRTTIIQNNGINNAGYWEGLSRISSYYFMFVTSIVSLYFLPKLSLAQTKEETKSLFFSYFKGILPVFVLALIIIYFSRDFIIEVLFTAEFKPMSKLFFWQLVGDTCKAASLILGMQFFAQKLTKAFIVSELFSLIVLYCSSFYFLSIYQIEGVVIAHAFTYFVYLVMLIIYFRKSLW